ncbi:MAG: hypothetical protein JSW46_03345 [Gemmatimonadota bacterium]|nr:MAG: hypothetical protein JSW46_03345 [Gemmatimonadota bacterium]
MRSFTSDSVTAAELGTTRLETEAGAHRLEWDLTYAGPDTLGGVEISGFTGGVKAPPGEYQVRLTVGDETQTRPITVLPDPRIEGVTQDDYDEQLRLGLAVRDTISRIYDELRRLASARDQLKSIQERASQAGYPSELTSRAESLVTALVEIEEELRQVKNQSGQDMLRFPPKLDTQFLTLYSYVTGVDNYSFGGPEGRPAAGAYTRFDDLNVEWATLRERLEVVLGTDVPAFNAELRQAEVPAVIVPR